MNDVIIMCIDDDNAIIVIREDVKTLSCASKFPWEREGLFVDNLGTRL